MYPWKKESRDIGELPSRTTRVPRCLQVCTDCQVIRMRTADPARPTDPLTALFVRAPLAECRFQDPLCCSG